MSYIGNSLTVQQYSPTITYFSGNASTTVFTLPIAVVSAAQIIVSVANVVQNPSSAFTVSGTTLTFTSAPPTGTNNIWVEYTSLQTNTIVPSNGTVGSAQLNTITTIPVSGGNTATLPAATGTVMVSGNMPAFSVYLNGNQNVTNNNWTKVQLNTKNFDTASYYDATTNYRFTPLVAGYYQLNGRVDSGVSTGTVSRCIASFYKNGSEFKRGSDANIAAGGAFGSTVSDVIYFNGSTDYVELFTYVSASTASIITGAQLYTYFSGCLIRAA